VDRRDLVIGFVGRLVLQKAPDVLLRAVARVVPRVPDAKLAMVGDGPLRQDLERLAVGLGVSERVLWLGERDARRLTAGFDVFAMPSCKEGLPYVGYDLALLKNAPHPNAARLLMEYYLGKTMQQSLARLGLLPTTADALTGVDPAVAQIETTKLLGTTDPERMNEMLSLAQQIYR